MALMKTATTASNKTPAAAPLLEAGGYPARVVRIIDLGKQPGSVKFPEPQYKMLVTFELLDEYMKETLEDGTPVMVQDPDEEPGVMMHKNLEDKPRWFDFEFSYNPDGFMGDNSHIYKFMKAVDALEVSPNLELGIQGHPAKELKDLLTEPLVVGLTTYTRQGGKNQGKPANKVSTFSPMKSKEKKEARPLINPTVFFDLGEPDLAVFSKLPGGDSEWAIKNRILANLEYNGSALQLALGGTPNTSNEPATNVASESQVDEAMQRELAAQAAAKAAQAEQNAGTANANIPF